MRSASSSSSSNCSSFPPNIDPSIAGSPPLFPPSSPPPPKPMGPVRIVTMLAAAGRVASSAWPASRPLAPRRGYRYLPRTMTPRPRGDRHHCRGTARGTDVAPYVFPLLHVLRAPIVHEYVSEYPTPSLLRRSWPRKHGGTVPPARAPRPSRRVRARWCRGRGSADPFASRSRRVRPYPPPPPPPPFLSRKRRMRRRTV